VIALDGKHAELDEPVGEQNARSRLKIFDEGRKSRGNHRGRSGNIAGGNGKTLTSLKLDGLVVLQASRSDFRSLQIAQNTEDLVLLPRHLPDHFDQFQLLRMGTMREVQARDIKTGADQLAKGLFIVRSRAKGSDNLSAALIFPGRKIRTGTCNVHPSPNCGVLFLRDESMSILTRDSDPGSLHGLVRPNRNRVFIIEVGGGRKDGIDERVEFRADQNAEGDHV